MVASLLSRECDRNVKFCICDSIIALDHGYVFQLVTKDLFIESAQIIGLLEDQGINASDWLRVEAYIDYHYVSYDSESGTFSWEVKFCRDICTPI